jgi:uncharacterized membrane protein (DUF485 family)
MADFGTSPLPDKEPEDLATSVRNSRIGLILFFVYSAAYFCFIALNAFRPNLMEETPFAGLNLAILYGLALIVGAFVLSIIYGWLCRKPARKNDGVREDAR